MKNIAKKSIFYAGVAMATFLTYASFTSTALASPNTILSACGEQGAPCTVQNLPGTCQSNEFFCGCGSDDGTKLGPTPTCGE